MMDHEQALEMAPAYQDGELSLSEALAFERHMARCEACRLELARQRDASAQLRQADLRVAAPVELARRIEAMVPGRKTFWQRLLGGSVAHPGSRSGTHSGTRFGTHSTTRSAGWAPLGLSLAGVAALAMSSVLYLQTPSSEQRLAQELVGNNIRSMQVDHLFDVASTDQHTVKPWFGGKLDFAPPVVDLKAQGYPLVGGRVDYLDGQRVAVMVYRDKLHPISLFVWPGGGADAAPQFEERKGYHIAHWRSAGMNNWVITDAGEADLRGFVGQLHAGAGG